MDWNALINAVITLAAQITAGVLADETLTEDEKKKFIDRISVSQASVPELK